MSTWTSLSYTAYGGSSLVKVFACAATLAHSASLSAPRERDEPGTEEGRSEGTAGRAGLSLCLSITPSPDLDLKRFHCAPGEPGVYVRQGTLEYSKT